MQLDDERSLTELLAGDGVLGVVRWIVIPSFSPECVHTFVYRADSVSIETVKNRDETRTAPDVVRRSTTLSFASSCVPPRIASWDSLVASARQAPDCMSCTLDGIAYRHHVRSADLALDAEWSNPRFPDHAMQVYLITDYQQLIDEADLFPEERAAAQKRKLIRRAQAAGVRKEKQRRKRG